jgi:elongation factor Ts
VIAHQAKEANIADKKVQFFIEGKLKKYYEQVCLMNQKLDMDATKTVQKYLQEISTQIKSPVEVVGFYRYAVGE